MTLSVNGDATYEGQKWYAVVGDEVAEGIVENGVVAFTGIGRVSTGTKVKVYCDRKEDASTIGIATYQWGDDEAPVELNYTAQVMTTLAVLPSVDIGYKYYKSGEQFRIPAIAKGKNVTIALYDARPYADDLGVAQSVIGSYSPIDIAGNVSTNSGTTWSAPKILIDVPNCFDCMSGVVNNASGAPSGASDLGDVCLTYDPEVDKFFVIGITGGGLSARNSSDVAGSWDCVMYTRGGGVEDEFADRRSIKAELLSGLSKLGVTTTFSGTNGILAGPGHGMVTKVTNSGRLVVPMQYFGPDGTRVFAAYSDDHGASWQVTKLAPSGYNSQENSIVELDDGSWYMIAKKGGGHSQSGRHLLHSTDFVNWTYLGEFTPSSSVQGSILKLGKNSSGQSRYAMAFDTSGGAGTNITQARYDLRLYFGTDDTSNSGTIRWDTENYLPIFVGSTGAKGYNSMILIDDNHLGILFEANGHIYFRKCTWE